MRVYSDRIKQGVLAADQTKIGVRLGLACVAAQIPVQVVAKWMKVSRQGVYYWFLGSTDIADEKQDRAQEIIGILAAATIDGQLPAKDITTMMQVIKHYRENKNVNS